MQSEVIILDSNIWISYVITKQLQTLIAIILKNRLTVLTSKDLVNEIHGVLMRPKFKKCLKQSDIKELMTLHLKLCHVVRTDETSNQLTDVKDNFLLDLYNKGKATVLVSGDKELLREADELNYHVMTLREFELKYST